MKKNLTKNSLPLLILVTALFFSFQKVAAKDYIEFSLDTVSTYDTLDYCFGDEDIRLTSPGEEEVVSWDWYPREVEDTAYATTLVLHNGYEGRVFCGFGDDLNGDTIYFYVRPFQIEAGKDLVATCGGSVQLSVDANVRYFNIKSYQWSPGSSLNDSTIKEPTATVDTATTFTVVVKHINGCEAEDCQAVTLKSIDVPEICMVGVDTSNKNMIVWEQTLLSNVDSVYIYKETLVTDVYEKIGAVANVTTNYFTDTASDPDIQSNKYKISYSGNCDLESDLSGAHKTLHLTINQGQNNIWNLIWESYEGFDVSTYRIYRGTTKTDLELIGTSSASNTQYSDLTAPEGTVYYQLEVVAPNDCSQLKSTSYSVSRSNIVGYEAKSGITSSIINDLTFYPNPVGNEVTIKVDNLANGNVNIINSNGAVMLYSELSSEATTIDLSALQAGVYYMQVISDKGTVVKKLLKN